MPLANVHARCAAEDVGLPPALVQVASRAADAHLGYVRAGPGSLEDAVT